MIYRVVLDGEDMYDEFPDSILIDPKLVMELNTAGSFEATIPYYHIRYALPKLLTQDIDIYESNDLIWFGRILDITLDSNMNKKIYCEGPYGYFNDTIQRPNEWDSVSLLTFFSTVIANHNAQVAENRRFTVGTVTITDKMVYRKLNYETTIDVLEDMCLNTDGGYFFFRKENGVQYIDWLKEMPYSSNQPVEYGMNLTELTQSLTGSEMYTAVLPLGATVDNEPVTVKSVNNDRDYIDSEAVETMGRIISVQEWSDIDDPTELLQKGQEWLSKQQFNKVSIECEAAELHYIQQEYVKFKIGQNINVISTPHLIDATFPLVKMTLALDEGVKKMTIGTVKPRELTEIIKDPEYSSGSGGSGGYSNSTVDSSPTQGSNNAVSSGGVYEAIGDLIFTVNEDKTVHVERRNSLG